MLTGMVLVPLNSTMIAVGLDAIAHQLGLSVAAAVWVVSAYLITMAVVQPLGGKAGDLWGHRRLFLAGAVVFLAGSVMGAAAASLPTLIVARCMQALGAGVTATNGSALLRRSFPTTLSQVLGNVGVVQSLGAAAGPLLGSLLIARFGWPSIFWVNLPVLATTILWGWRVLPPDAPRLPARPLDIPGAVGLGGILVSATLALKNLAVWAWLLIPGALAAIWFVHHERRAAEPVVSLSLFRRPGFLVANGSILAANGFMYTLLLWTPLFLRAHRVPLTTVGVILLGFSLMSSGAAFGGSRLLSSGRMERGALVRLSFAVDAAAIVLPFLLPTATQVGADMLVLLTAGLGSGLGTVAMQSTALLAARRDQAGTASGVYSTSRYLGSILASAALSWLVPLPPLYLAVLGAVALLGILMSFGYPRPLATSRTLSA